MFICKEVSVILSLDLSFFLLHSASLNSFPFFPLLLLSLFLFSSSSDLLPLSHQSFVFSLSLPSCLHLSLFSPNLSLPLCSVLFHYISHFLPPLLIFIPLYLPLHFCFNLLLFTTLLLLLFSVIRLLSPHISLFYSPLCLSDISTPGFRAAPPPPPPVLCL